MIAMKYTALVTVASVVLTFVLSLRVGKMRQVHGVEAPATSGHPEFERANRVHQNTIEQVVLFLPLLWLGLYVLGDALTGLIGAVWIVGRIVYANAYTRDPAARHAHHLSAHRRAVAGDVVGHLAGVYRLGRSRFIAWAGVIIQGGQA